MTKKGHSSRRRILQRCLRPSSSPSAPRRSEVRRGALIEAAGTLFVEQGVDATTVDDIAKRAGVAKGTSYHRSEEHTSELQSLMRITYAVLCLKNNKFEHTHQSI